MANASDQRIHDTIEYLYSFQDYEKPLFVFPIHCSGEKFLFELMKLEDPRIKASNASVGTVFTFTSE